MVESWTSRVITWEGVMERVSLRYLIWGFEEGKPSRMNPFILLSILESLASMDSVKT